EQVQRLRRHGTTDFEKAAKPAATVEHDDLVHRRMAAHERRRTRLQHPRDVAGWVVALERRHHRQHVHRIADRAHHHDADAAAAHDRRSRTKTTSRIAFGAAHSSNNASIEATGVRSMRSPASTYTWVKRSHTVRRYAVRVMPDRRMP